MRDAPGGQVLAADDAHARSLHPQAIKDAASPVFESTDRSDPGVVAFAAPGFPSFSTDQVTYECTYDNNSNNTIISGENFATDEMCVAVGFFFPATNPRFCLDNQLVPCGPPRRLAVPHVSQSTMPTTCQRTAPARGSPSGL
jgi:hypothetical protein